MFGWDQEGNGDSRSSEENRSDNGNHATQSPVATIFSIVKSARSTCSHLALRLWLPTISALSITQDSIRSDFMDMERNCRCISWRLSALKCWTSFVSDLKLQSSSPSFRRSPPSIDPDSANALTIASPRDWRQVHVAVLNNMGHIYSLLFDRDSINLVIYKMWTHLMTQFELSELSSPSAEGDDLVGLQDFEGLALATVPQT
jgi:hypothetical protein